MLLRVRRTGPLVHRVAHTTNRQSQPFVGRMAVVLEQGTAAMDVAAAAAAADMDSNNTTQLQQRRMSSLGGGNSNKPTTGAAPFFLTGLSAANQRPKKQQPQQQRSNDDDDDNDGNSKASAATSDNSYISPFQDLFDRMHRNGPTTLGTTDECLELERSILQQQSSSSSGENTTTRHNPNTVLSCGIPEHVLRFTTTSFGRTLVAPHVHPTEHAVVLKVHTRHLPFDDATNANSLEMRVLREIVGAARLNPDRRELRLSSNQFGSRMENKRHLVSMLDRIILSCRRMAAAERDTANHQQSTTTTTCLDHAPSSETTTTETNIKQESAS